MTQEKFSEPKTQRLQLPEQRKDQRVHHLLCAGRLCLKDGWHHSKSHSALGGTAWDAVWKRGKLAVPIDESFGVKARPSGSPALGHVSCVPVLAAQEPRLVCLDRQREGGRLVAVHECPICSQPLRR